MVACEHLGVIELIMAIGAPQSQSRWQSPVSILAPLSSLWQSQSRWQSPASILAPLSLRSGAPHTPSSSTCSSGNQWQSAPLRAHHGNQWQSMAINGNQWQSMAINGNQRRFGPIMGHRAHTPSSNQSMAMAINDQWQSSAIVRTRRARAPAAAETQSIAIHRNQLLSAVITCRSWDASRPAACARLKPSPYAAIIEPMTCDEGRHQWQSGCHQWPSSTS
jgi:hypothetical protein